MLYTGEQGPVNQLLSQLDMPPLGVSYASAIGQKRSVV